MSDHTRSSPVSSANTNSDPIDTQDPQTRFTYTLFGSDVPALLSSHAATVLCVSQKLLALGTREGYVHILDFDGNTIKTFKEHNETINCLCFDGEIEHLASSSSKMIAIHGLYSDTVQRYSYKYDITAIALDPRFSSRKTQEFIYGTASGCIYLSSKGWLGQSETLLFQGKSTILAIKIQGVFLAWATESGIKIYDLSTHTKIGKIDTLSFLISKGEISRSSNNNNNDASGSKSSYNHGVCCCCMEWIDSNELLVGWGSNVLIIGVIAKQKHKPGSSLAATNSENIASQHHHHHRSSTTPTSNAAAAAAAINSHTSTSTHNDIAMTHARNEALITSAEGITASTVQAASGMIARALAFSSATLSSSSSASTALPPPPPPPPQQQQQQQQQQQAPSPSTTDAVTMTTATTSSTDGRPGTLGGYSVEVLSSFKVDVAASRNDASLLSSQEENKSGVIEVVMGVACFGPHEVAVLAAATDGVQIQSLPNIVAAYRLCIYDRRGQLLFADDLNKAVIACGIETQDDAKSARGGIGIYNDNDDDMKNVMHSPLKLASYVPSHYRRQHLAAADGTSTSTGSTGKRDRGSLTWWNNDDEPLYYILCPHTIILGKPKDAHDRITWLTQHHRYADALALAETDSTLPDSVRRDIGERYLQYIFEEKQDYPLAASVCPRVLGCDATAWERWVYSFAQVSRLPVIAPYVPILADSDDTMGATESQTKTLSLSVAAMTSTTTARMSTMGDTRWKKGQSSTPARMTTPTPITTAAATSRSSGKDLARLLMSTSVYDLILAACARSHDTADLVLLKDLVVTAWPSTVYAPAALLAVVQLRLSEGEHWVKKEHANTTTTHGDTASITSTATDASPSAQQCLQRTAAALYSSLGQHANALRLLIALGLPQSFECIRDHALANVAASMASELMDIDEAQALSLLVESWEDAVPALVVASLESSIQSETAAEPGAAKSMRLYRYIERLWKKDPTAAAPFASTHVRLCAQYDPGRLLSFLSSDASYSLEDALTVCKQHDLTREAVYVLGRMGSTDEALTLIVKQLRDVGGAVAFVLDQQMHREDDHADRLEDEDLWDLLISLTLGDATLAGELLDHAGKTIKPQKIIKAIPDDMVIERLRERLTRIISDFRTTLSLQSGCNTILQTDCLDLADALYSRLRRALTTLHVVRAGGRVVPYDAMNGEAI